MKKTLVLLLFFFLSFSIFAQNKPFQGSITVEKRFLSYQISPDPTQAGKWQLQVKTVEKDKKTGSPYSYVVYVSAIYWKENQGKPEQVKIFGARQNGYLWNSMVSDFLKVSFANGAVSYQTEGELLKNPENISKIPDNQVVSKTTALFNTNEGLKIAIEYFLKKHLNLLPFSDKPAKKEGELWKGQIVYEGRKYFYEMTQDFYQKGDHDLKIRNEQEAIAYNSLIRFRDKTAEKPQITVEIHYAKFQGLAWGVYESDFLRSNFDFQTGKANYERIGVVIPNPTAKNGILEMFEPANFTLKQGIEAAVRYFIAQYEDKFLKP